MYKICLGLGLGLAVRLLWANPIAVVEPWLSCSLDDAGSIQALGGQISCGSFVPGILGSALRLEATENLCITLPSEPSGAGFPWESGSLDFWFRLEGWQGPLPLGRVPGLVLLEQDGSRYGVWLGQEPATGLVGLIGAAGVDNFCATTDSGYLTYEDLAPHVSPGVWHHLALFWVWSGIPEAGQHRLALFVDGQGYGSAWSEAALPQFPALPESSIRMIINELAQGTCELDELHVFPYWPELGWTVNELSLHYMLNPGQPWYTIAVAQDPPRGFQLAQNTPNPFNPNTTITFQLPQSEFVTLKLYDPAGREVATLLEGVQGQGLHELRFDGSALASGVYYYRLEAGALRETRGMLLLK